MAAAGVAASSFDTLRMRDVLLRDAAINRCLMLSLSKHDRR
jgi:hypothetical protein